MRNFIYKLRRSWSWFLFTWKQQPFEDDYMIYLELQLYALKRMLNDFKDKEISGALGESINKTITELEIVINNLENCYNNQSNDSAPIYMQEANKIIVNKYQTWWT